MVEHVQVWLTKRAKSQQEIDAQIEAWILERRPKEIKRYEENGHIVRVFEAHHGYAY